ncbi:MAG: bifunctional N-acetylglucosamine-1-phosphate uridyltransferase/glucosamine-1-phosphate acetyltransferase [Chloroflexi bacterium]|nr:MAG: bifunctional N-acetylglucosamine-1-phosphate uridyltransferase/glucosamine-1-phosphate acetyltransferase [Chloroflexota bacterium]
MSELGVVILAAGQGTRMRSKRQKILHEVGGRPMVAHVFAAATAVSHVPPVLVIGPSGGEAVRALLGEQALYVEQPEQLGTGHATKMARSVLRGRTQQVLVTYADMPLLRAGTMQKLATVQAETGVAVVMLSVIGDPKSSFGRVVRDGNGRVVEIVEVTDARRRPNATELLAIREQNAGIYCFDAEWLWNNLDQLPLHQARSGPEYYLTDLIEMAVGQGRGVEALVAEDPDECLGAGTRAELAVVEQAFRRRVNRYWLEQGVTLIDPATVYIDDTAQIGQDTIIWPNSYVQGQTVIGEDCVIGPNAIVRDARLGDGCIVTQAVVEKVELASGTQVMPFTVVRGED